MKLNKFETHDRLQHFKKQSNDIGECCQDIINQRPFGSNPFYIFAHARTCENGIDKELIWQPRLTKPRAETNSMLFRVSPTSDNVEIIWMIPAEEMWGQYQKGKMTEHKIVIESIHDYLHDRGKLEAKHREDLPDSKIDAIYRDIARKARKDKSKLVI